MLPTPPRTTIQLSVGVKELLSSIGRKGETYEDIILRLIKSKDRVGRHRFLFGLENTLRVLTGEKIENLRLLVYMTMSQLQWINYIFSKMEKEKKEEIEDFMLLDTPSPTYYYLLGYSPQKGWFLLGQISQEELLESF